VARTGLLLEAALVCEFGGLVSRKYSLLFWPWERSQSSMASGPAIAGIYIKGANLAFGLVNFFRTKFVPQTFNSWKRM
jgi:hypothetical protein